MTDDGPLLQAALELAGRGWPVFPCKPKAKEPLTRQGVKDATTTPDQIRAWWGRWPHANLAVACGTPGPTVLDIDKPTEARQVLALLEPLHAPTAATARGRHLYFAGLARGTVSLGYGELRGQGSYVIAPPSIHPTGKDYTWLDAPHGRLSQVPDFLQGETAGTAGTGPFEPPAELVKHGARHDFLKDIAVRTVRSGIVDVPTLILILTAAYETHCTKTPKAKPNEFKNLAEWAAKTDIAQREREVAEEGGDKPRREDLLDHAPHGDAPLAEHRDYLRAAGGWGPHVDIKDVRRKGGRLVDALEIHLTNGQTVEFDRQDQITSRGHWQKAVIADTDGIAHPPALKEHQLMSVFRSLCILAGAPAKVRESEALEDAVRDFLGLCEPITDHDLTGHEGRYDAIARCRARPAYEPKNTENQPVCLVDEQGHRYIRGGELRDYLIYRNLGLSTSQLPGRMAGIGFAHVVINGREADRFEDGRPRRTGRLVLYRLP